MTTPQEKKDWREEFREKFLSFGSFPCENGQSCEIEPEEVIAFISRIEQEAYERGKIVGAEEAIVFMSMPEKREEGKVKIFDEIRSQARAEVMNEVVDIVEKQKATYLGEGGKSALELLLASLENQKENQPQR